MKHLAILAALLSFAACNKSEGKTKPKASADWGDDPRPLGACVGTVKPGVELPKASQPQVCLENQTEQECTRASEHFDYAYTEHHTCASVGFEKRCDGGDYPASARFKACPGNTTDTAAPATPATPAPAAAAPNPKLEVAKQIVAIFESANRAAEAANGDCVALGKALAPLRDQLWELGKANPHALKAVTETELAALKAADTFGAIADKLPACKDNVHAKEFAFAMGKVL